MDDLGNLLMEMQEQNKELLETLKKVLDAAIKQQQNFSDLNQYATGIDKVLKDFDYYKNKGRFDRHHIDVQL